MSEVSLRAGLRRRAARAESPVSFFEFWPGWLFYIPVVLFWTAKALRHRSITLPTLANPSIEAGGLVGESKTDILDLAGPVARAAIAPYVGVTTTGHRGGDSMGIAEFALKRAGLGYPLVAKPDVSCNGVGVRIVHNRADLARYISEFPCATRLQLQALVTHEGEAGIFYIREPHETTGRITSVTLKYPPMVTGDGTASVKALIEGEPRLKAISRLLLPKLGAKAHHVPAAGETVRLVFVGNHCRGSTFRDGAHIVSDVLTARIDEIARDMPNLHFARFDLRYRSLPELREGRGFTIIEVNGTGAEATNIWDPEMTIGKAYRTQFFHYGTAFRIGAALRAAGGKPIGPAKLFCLWRTQKKLMRRYPEND